MIKHKLGTPIEIAIGMSNEQTDKSQQILKEYEDSQKEFNNHWVWKELGCKPDEFFGALKKHVSTLNIPQAEWQKIYNRTKDAQRIKALERTQGFKQNNFKFVGAIRA